MDSSHLVIVANAPRLKLVLDDDDDDDDDDEWLLDL
jgi:hypothetical protein